MNEEQTSEFESEQDETAIEETQTEAVGELDDSFQMNANDKDRDMSSASMPVDASMLRQIVEGALLAAGQPLTVSRLLELFDEAVAPAREEVLAALDDIAEANAERGFELREVASGYRLQVRKELAPWINRLWEEKPQKYSRALLETLSLIAYRQPITRGDIEEIRGVAVSSHIMKTLMERDWVKVVGQRDVPGRPSLYATTRQFLDYFNLKSLDELPSLGEIRDLDEFNTELDLGDTIPPRSVGESQAGQYSESVGDDGAPDEGVEDECAENHGFDDATGSLFESDESPAAAEDEFEAQSRQAEQTPDWTGVQDSAEQVDKEEDDRIA